MKDRIKRKLSYQFRIVMFNHKTDTGDTYEDVVIKAKRLAESRGLSGASTFNKSTISQWATGKARPKNRFLLSLVSEVLCGDPSVLQEMLIQCENSGIFGQGKWLSNGKILEPGWYEELYDE